MIAPQGEWHEFSSEDKKILYLKKVKLITEKAKEIKAFYYKGVFADNFVKCDICGYTDEDIAVISVNDELHCIGIDCLKEMQPTKADKELYHLQ